MKSTLFFCCCILWTTIIIITNVVTTTSAATVTTTTTNLAPCTWSSEISYSSIEKLSPEIISSALNSLYQNAIMNNNNSTSNQIRAVVASVIFTSNNNDNKKKQQEETAASSINILSVPYTSFVEQLLTLQKTIISKKSNNNNCDNQILQLTLIVKNEKQQQERAKLSNTEANDFVKLLQRRGPIFYSVVATPTTKTKTSDDDNEVEKIFKPKNLSLFHYEGELLPLVVHKFLLSLRDAVPIVVAEKYFEINGQDGSCFPSSSSEQQESKNGKEEEQEQEKKVETFEQKRNKCISKLFKQIKSISSSLKIKSAYKKLGADSLLRKVNHASDIIFARDEIQPKRVVFVLNDAAVVPNIMISSSNKNNKNKNKKNNNNKKQLSTSISSIILSAASQGRVLFLWYRWTPSNLEIENKFLEKNRPDFKDRYPSSDLVSIRRVNLSLWNVLPAENNPAAESGKSGPFMTTDLSATFQNPRFSVPAWFKETPYLFVLSESQVDDGVIRFRGNWSYVNVASSLSPSQLLEGGLSAKDVIAVEQEQQQQNNQQHQSSSDPLIQEKFLVEKHKTIFLAPNVQSEVVTFIQKYANPGLLDPMFDLDRDKFFKYHRYIGIFFVKTLGYDRSYTHQLSSGFYQAMLAKREYLKYGLRCGGLVEFTKMEQKTAAAGDEQQQQQRKKMNSHHLVPIAILNSVLHGNLAVELSLSTVSPAFGIYDRRDRRLITDRREFVPEKLDVKALKDGAVSVWKRASSLSSLKNNNENFGLEDDDDVDEFDKEQQLLLHQHRKRKNFGITEEATTAAGRVMETFENVVPIFRDWRLYMRITPEDMLLCIGAAVLSFVVVISLVIILYLVKLPENALKNIVEGTEEEQEALKKKVRDMVESKNKESKKER